VGSVTRLGEIRFPLAVNRAAHWKITVTIAGTHNSWDMWV
jgi:hypothetical protein